jgi:hypothetical protein
LDTQDFRRAYSEFLDAAQRQDFGPPADGGWNADMVLAHVIVGDRLIAEAAAKIMAGVPTSFDNLASQSEPYLQSVIDAAGSRDGLLAEVRRTGDELIALIERMTEEQASTPLQCKVVSDNAVVFDTTFPLAALLRAPVDTHLHMHSQQLAALASQPHAVHAP